MANDKTIKTPNKAVIEPGQVIDERKRLGQQPSCDLPMAAILCYDSAFWHWIGSHPKFASCDGWLTGSFLAPCAESQVLIAKVPGFGSPTAVMTLEELSAYGITRFVNLGTAGGLQQDLSIGDLVVCDRAFRDEGTSRHYIPDEAYSHACPTLTRNICAMLEQEKIAFHTGTTWTTDAPYRETIKQFRHHRANGVMTVEMEASALFTVGEFRGVSVGTVFAISDLLSENRWQQGYHSDEKLDALKSIFEMTLASLAVNGSCQ